MTLVTWRGVIGHCVTIFWLRVSSLPLTRCLRVFWMVFVQKRRLSFFSHWLMPNGEVAKLTWTSVTDIKIPRYTFHRYCYGYQSLKVSKWSVIWCSYDQHSNFFLGEATCRDLVTWHWPTWFWNFHKVCGKDVWTGVPKRRRSASPFFFRYLRKAWGWGVQTPPTRRGYNS